MTDIQTQQNLKVLLVTDLYPIEKDDTIPFIIKDFACALNEFGLKVEVVRSVFLPNSLIRKHKIIKNGIYEKDGVKIYNRNFILPFLNNNTDYLQNNYDCIISHMPSGHIYADLINQKLKLPHISILHYSDYHVLNDFKYRFYFKKRLEKALDNSTLKGARNAYLAKTCGCDFVLSSYIEKFVQEKKLNSKEKLKLITLSKLIERKKIQDVIEALSKAEFDFEYNIYGKGNYKNHLQKLIKKYNLEDKIKLKGYIEHDKINKVLDDSDIFILPSVRESFGVCYLEAMARGLITIARTHEGMEGIIQNNQNGFLINSKDEILPILKSLAQNTSLKEEIIKNTLLNIKNFNKNSVIKKYIDIIFQICKTRYHQK